MSAMARATPLTLALVTALLGCADASDDAGATDPADIEPCADAQRYAGEATYYDADGSGNCSFPASPEDLMVAAMNETVPNSTMASEVA